MTQEEQLINLESNMAHIEQIVESINETIIEQDKTIQSLQTQVNRLTAAAESSEIDKIKNTIKKPPHYQ
ncbi:MAG: hypothetical protein CBC62_05895 [Opitutia bacterium TMED102]|nr:MAG: hypothetical protein CBC62_05895 [Opitutae bacterium TMED102]